MHLPWSILTACIWPIVPLMATLYLLCIIVILCNATLHFACALYSMYIVGIHTCTYVVLSVMSKKYWLLC